MSYRTSHTPASLFRKNPDLLVLDYAVNDTCYGCSCYMRSSGDETTVVLPDKEDLFKRYSLARRFRPMVD